MAQTLRYLSAYNGFVPEATGEVVAYISTEGEFNLNKYCQMIPTPAKVGLYCLIGRDESIRSVSDEEDAWEDGGDRPRGDYNKTPFTVEEFRTVRRATASVLGYDAIDQTTLWKPKLVYMASNISKRMTSRTNRVIKLLETVANWGVNTGTANTLNGGAGKWDTASDDPSSPFFEAIYGSILAAAQAIHLATNAKVKPPDLNVIISPIAAGKMSKAPEIINYVRQTPQAVMIVKEGLDPQYDLWGLPSTYRGFKLVVEDRPIVNVRPNTANLVAASGSLHPPEEAAARSYIKSSTSAIIAARPGSLNGEYGSPSFSTIQIYHHGPLMQVEVFDEPKHRRVEMSCVEDLKEILASNVSGYLIQSIL